MTYLVSNVLYLAGQKGTDQKKVAKAAGVAQSTVSRIYRNEIGDTGYKSVQKLAAFFGVTMDDLVNRDIKNDGVSSRSQTERLDPETLAAAMSFLKRVSRMQAVPIDFSVDAEALLYAYKLVAQEPSGSDREPAIEQMVEWLRARSQQNAEMDGRDAGRPRGGSLRTGESP